MIVVAHLWQSTVCLALAALIALALRRGAADIRYRIWLLASAKFLVPFSALAAAGGAAASWVAPFVTPAPVFSMAWLQRPIAIWNLQVSASADAPAASEAMWIFTVVAVWAAGVVVLTVWRWSRWRELADVIERSQQLANGREANALAKALRASRLVHRVDLRASDARLEPTLIGVRHPLLLWPDRLSSRLSDEELDAVIAHEICHASRRDNLTALIQIAAETVFWFYPPIWWVGTRLTVERERACDEEVLRLGRDRDSYAQAILEVCRFCLRRPLMFGSNVGGGNLTTRIVQIMKHTPVPPPSRMSKTALAAIATVILAAPFASGAAVTGWASATAAQETEPYRPGKDVTAPKLIHEVKPQYTKRAMDAKIQGVVQLEVVIDANGEVGETKVTKSLDEELDQAAVTAVKQWRFEPGKKDGKPVAVRVDIEMSFRLK
jgi:TonB family protein